MLLLELQRQFRSPIVLEDQDLQDIIGNNQKSRNTQLK
jgi:hypothetical protein